MRVLLVLLAAVAAGLGSACQQPQAQWDDVPAAPGGEPYAGPDTARLDERIAGRVVERSAVIVGDRVERLPAGTTWAEHLAFRDGHVPSLHRVRDVVPEPDAPVLYAEWSAAARTLLVVGVVGGDGRLVVRTTLLAPA
ncbi:MAG: hypothetical protein AB7G09_14755 [Pseudonocardia sp.]